MDEKIDVLDGSGSPTGETVYKSEVHRRGLWHRCFHCWVSGTDASGEPYLLVQRRAVTKDTWPGYLDVSAAGHLRSGESTMDGLRELEEELGLRASPERLVALGTRRIEQEIPGGLDRELHEVFLLFDSTAPGSFHLQREEVEAVIPLKLDDAERLYSEETVPAKECSDGDFVFTRVSLADFVPNDDYYLRRVARAARQVLAGEPPGRVFGD